MIHRFDWKWIESKKTHYLNIFIAWLSGSNLEIIFKSLIKLFKANKSMLNTRSVHRPYTRKNILNRMYGKSFFSWNLVQYSQLDVCFHHVSKFDVWIARKWKHNTKLKWALANMKNSPINKENHLPGCSCFIKSLSKQTLGGLAVDIVRLSRKKNRKIIRNFNFIHQ